MELTVVTYGGGRVLYNIFNSIALLVNGDSSNIVRPLMIIAASIGGLWTISRAFFLGSAQGILGKFALPLLLVVGLLMVPTSKVRIEDRLNQQDIIATVSNVPMFLAKFAQLTSSIAYQLTKQVETVMHRPQSLTYEKTGMIFAADTALEMKHVSVQNAALDQNLRRFAKQCVLYDVALGRYTVNDIKTSTDLWKLFGENTSKVRMMKFDPLDPTSQSTGVGRPTKPYRTCKVALGELKEAFDQEKQRLVGHHILKNLPLTFQALTGKQMDAEQMIGQKLMMQLLSDEYSNNQFAVSRANEQQRNTYQILGALSSRSIVVMRIVFEAIIYASFIFILPMSVIPGGLKFIGNWMFLTLWVQLWPPFYAILDYIMQTVSQGWSISIFPPGTAVGLSFFTNAGLSELYQDVHALTGYLSASIPFLSYAILKGGVSSFIHLAGSMMTPAHSAAGAAAAEQATGNYSFANTSYGQTSFGNSSALQSNLAPSLSSGYFAENRGTSSMVYGGSENILRQSNSELRTSLFGDRAYSESANQAAQYAESFSEQSQKLYMDSLASHGREFVDYSQHLSSSANYSDSTSVREGYDLQESARYLESVASNWGEQYGLNQRESMEILGSVGASGGLGIDFMGIKFGGSVERRLADGQSASRDEILNSAMTVSNSEDFQRNYQSVVGASRSDTFSMLNDEGSRLAESVSQSFDTVQHTQNQHLVARNASQQISSAMSATDQSSLQMRENLNQEFMNWSSESYANRGGFSYVADTLTKGSSPEKLSIVQDFVGHMQSSSDHVFSVSGPQVSAAAAQRIDNFRHSPQQTPDPLIAKNYSNSVVKQPDRHQSNTATSGLFQSAQRDHLIPGRSQEQGADIGRSFHSTKQGYNQNTAEARGGIAQQQDRISGRFEGREGEGLLKRVGKGTDRPQALIGNYNYTEPPLWLRGEE